MDTTGQMKTEYELQLHKLCFDKAPIGIFRVGTDSRVLAANDQACSSLGYAPDELRGMSIFAIKPDMTPETVEEYLREMRASGSITFEAFHRRKDGTRFPVEVWISPIEFQENEHRYCFVHDISRRKQAEEALRHAHEELESRVLERTREITELNEKLTREIHERIRVEEELHRSQKMLQLVMDNIPQRVFWKDRDLRYLGCNQSFAEHAGLRDPSEIVGMDDTLMPWKADAGAYQAQDREIMEHDRVTLGYLSAQTQQDDRVLWLRKNKLPLHDQDGRVIGVLGTFQDITESKRIQQTLTKKETILAEAQSIAHLGSWEYCLGTDREYRSREFFHILGIPAETSGFARDSMFDYIHPLDRERVRGRITETLEHGKHYDVEYRIIGADGVERHVHAKGKTVTDDYDRTTKFIGTIQDITERKQTEEALLFTQFSVDQAAIPIFWIARDGRFAYCNHACSYLGYSPEYLASLTIFDINPELSQEQWERDWTRCREEEVVTFESRHKTSAGIFVPVQITATYMENRGHEYYVAFVKDISRRKRAEEKTAIQLRRLASLRTIDTAITGSLDLGIVLSVILDQVTPHFGADASDILVLNQAYLLEHAAGRGFRMETGKKSRWLGRGVAGEVVRERRTIHIPDVRGQEDHRPDLSHRDEGFITYYGAPLIAKGKVVGVLEIYYRCQRTLEQDEVDFLETLAGQTAIAIDNATLFTGLQKLNTELTLAYDSTLEGWSRALDLRDKESDGHSRRVTELTVTLAREMGIRDSELIHVRRGAMLHDIGKMGIPDKILLKPGPLDVEERTIMEKHPVYAFEFLSSTEFLQQALNIPYSHHERWDGTGYPRRLMGEQIPLAARIFSIVDVWDALRSDRPYRKAWSREKTRLHILERSGTHFDPAVVEAFLKVIDDFPCASGGGM
jgi:PAS domain S-box-containing protein/putative nucleotidyltransferase with HDIG domain